MNGVTLIRLILNFVIWDISRWNPYIIFLTVIIDLMWTWEYNKTVKELEEKLEKYDKTSKRNRKTQSANPKDRARETTT